MDGLGRTAMARAVRVRRAPPRWPARAAAVAGFFQIVFRIFDRARTLMEQIRIRHRIEHEKTDPSPYPYLLQQRLDTIKNSKNYLKKSEKC